MKQIKNWHLWWCVCGSGVHILVVVVLMFELHWYFSSDQALNWNNLKNINQWLYDIHHTDIHHNRHPPWRTSTTLCVKYDIDHTRHSHGVVGALFTHSVVDVWCGGWFHLCKSAAWEFHNDGNIVPVLDRSNLGDHWVCGREHLVDKMTRETQHQSASIVAHCCAIFLCYLGRWSSHKSK